MERYYCGLYLKSKNMALEYAFALTRRLALAEEAGAPAENTWEALASSRLLAHNRDGAAASRAADGGADSGGGGESETDSDSEVSSVASDDMGHGRHSHAAEVALRARGELVQAVDFFLQWKDALVESYPLPPAALLPILTVAAQLLRCRDVLGNNIATLCTLAQSFARGLLSDEHVHRLKTEAEQARLAAGMERARRVEVTRKARASLALLRRMDGEVRYVRWYRLFLKLRQREGARHAETQIAALRATVGNLKQALDELRKALKKSENKQVATAKVAVKNQTRAETLQKELKRAGRRERKLRAELVQAQTRLEHSFQERDAMQTSLREERGGAFRDAQHAGPRRSGVINDGDDGERCGDEDDEAAPALLDRGGNNNEADGLTGEAERTREEVESSLNDRAAELRQLAQTPDEVKALFQTEEEMEVAMQAAVAAAVDEEYEEVAASRAQAERIAAPLQKRRESMGLVNSISDRAGTLPATIATAIANDTATAAAADADDKDNDGDDNVANTTRRWKSNVVRAPSPAGMVHAPGNAATCRGDSETTARRQDGAAPTHLAKHDAASPARAPSPQQLEPPQIHEAGLAAPSPMASSPVVRAARASSERRNKLTMDTGASNTTTGGYAADIAPPNQRHVLAAAATTATTATTATVTARDAMAPAGENADVPINMITRMNQAHAQELMQVRQMHAQQVEMLKLTMATLQEKLIRRGRELAKFRKSKDNFKNRFAPAGPFGGRGEPTSSQSASADTRMRQKGKKKKHNKTIKKPASKKKSGSTVKFSTGNILGNNMSEIAAPWSVHDAASSRPETVVSMAVSGVSTSQTDADSLVQYERSNAARARARPSTVNTVVHQAPVYYLSPTDRTISDAALTDVIRENSNIPAYFADGRGSAGAAPGQPLRLPANFMPLAPPRLASQASQSNALREQHDRLLGVRRAATSEEPAPARARRGRRRAVRVH